MRVIGGEARGRHLAAPRGRRTRPTADRVREALFNVLARSVPGARVLDLYAGSGALGIEALSRGAREAVFVESDPAVARVLRKNLDDLQMASRGRLVVMDTRVYLRKHSPEDARFDLIFADPPYTMNADFYQELLEAIAASGATSAGGRLILEHPAADFTIRIPRELVKEQLRRYGDTAVTILKGC
ncbi:MAG: 16S rRNA (guanine(966)-N(2))-methyltransferase RsmD [Candidatus Geothermincolia bacterium]